MKSFILTTAVFVFSFSNVVAHAQWPGDPYQNVSSGMLLGVYCQANGYGLRVNSTIPGYSAVGRLQPGDVLMRMTAVGMPMYDLYSLGIMEQAKSAIGPNREAAVEFYRPGCGYQYAFVTFTPLYGPAAATTGVKSYSAQFKLESEKPGARNLFQKTPRKFNAPGLGSGTSNNSNNNSHHNQGGHSHNSNYGNNFSQPWNQSSSKTTIFPPTKSPGHITNPADFFSRR